MDTVLDKQKTSGDAKVKQLEVRNISKTFFSKRHPSVRALIDVSFEVTRGETVMVLGSSGSGKSTLLYCLNGLESCDSGSIKVAGRELIGRSSREQRRIRQDIGMVFQQFNLFPHLTVRGNLNLAQVHVRKKSKEEANDLTEKLLREVEIMDKIDSYPSELSGGQQQRVAIARALAMEPHIMLFDEPTSALDPELVHEVLQVMRRLANTDTTMLVVTHEMNFAKEAGDRIIFMDEARIVEDSPKTEFFSKPKTERARAFISSWD